MASPIWAPQRAEPSEAGPKGTGGKFDYDVTNNVSFCEVCIGGRRHRSHFETSKTHTKEPLKLVHSDVCGKMSEKSIRGAEYSPHLH